MSVINSLTLLFLDCRRRLPVCSPEKKAKAFAGLFLAYIVSQVCLLPSIVVFRHQLGDNADQIFWITAILGVALLVCGLLSLLVCHFLCDEENPRQQNNDIPLRPMRRDSGNGTVSHYSVASSLISLTNSMDSGFVNTN